MQMLERVEQLAVVQKKEWGEILTDLEQRNKYRVFGPDGQEMFRALETGGAFLTRFFLSSWRPFEMTLTTPEGTCVLQLRRPFKFFFTEIHVADASGRKLGHVQRRFSTAGFQRSNARARRSRQNAADYERRALVSRTGRTCSGIAQDGTTHYSGAELSKLIEAANRVSERGLNARPELVALRRLSVS